MHSALTKLMHNHIFTVAAWTNPLLASSLTPSGVDARTQRGRAHMPTATSAALIKYLHASTHTSTQRDGDASAAPGRRVRRHRCDSTNAAWLDPCIGLPERLTAKSAFIGAHSWPVPAGKLGSS